MFKGLFTALITPFKYGQFDEEAYEKLIEWQIESGVNGLVSCGTTGEMSALSKEEHIKIIETCIKIARRRVPVIASTGTNSTTRTIEMTEAAKDLGADAAMIISPYYNRPVQEGLYQHFKCVAETVDIPIILYNIPYRCAVDISDETIVRLAKIKNIVGLKDSTGSITRVSNLLHEVPRGFSILSGSDDIALGFNAQGGIGCVSIAANIMPKLCTKIQDYWFQSNWQKAFELQNMLMPLYNSMFCESNPVPIKYAASLLGICTSDVRLPLVPLSERNKKYIKEVVNTTIEKVKNYEQQEEYCISES